MVVGTSKGIVMIEAVANDASEAQVVDAIEFGHGESKKICAAINQLRDQAGKPKREVKPPEIDETYLSDLRKRVGERLADALNTQKYPKAESYAKVKAIKDELKAAIAEDDK